MVKNLPAMQVQFLGWKDPLEKGMATHTSILAWRISWRDEPTPGSKFLLCFLEGQTSVDCFTITLNKTYRRLGDGLGGIPFP